MNDKINLDSKTIELLFNRYKAYFLPLLMIIASISIFFFVVVPQFTDYLSSRAEKEDASKRLETTNTNIRLLSSLSDETLDSQSSIVSSALPPIKDYVGILNSLSIASEKSGTSLGDYSFQVGDIASKTTKQKGGFPELVLSVNILGGAENASKFIKQLEKTLPISEVSGIKFGNNITVITISFFFKPFPIYNLNEDTKAQMLSVKQQNLLSNLEQFYSLSK